MKKLCYLLASVVVLGVTLTILSAAQNDATTGRAWFTPPKVVCSGTFTFNPTSINSGSSQTITQACTGAVAGDHMTLNFNASPLAVTGYVPSTSGIITIVPWLTADTINAAAVNNTASAIDPGARSGDTEARRTHRALPGIASADPDGAVGHRPHRRSIESRGDVSQSQREKCLNSCSVN